MKYLLIVVVSSLAAISLAGAADMQLKDQKDKVSYSIGLEIGTTLKRQSIDVDQSILQRGIQDGVTGAKPLMTEEETHATMTAFQKEMVQKQQAKRKELSDKNAAEGKTFLDANKSKSGVKTTASGLQYKVEKEGTGPMPKETDTVKVNYRGTLLDGTEFDSSFKRNQPATFPVNRVIKGWTEGLQLMRVGSKYQFFIPANLAYGERGAGQEIGPNAVLTFDVELLSIEKPQESPSPKPVTPPATGTAKTGITPMVKPTATPTASSTPEG